MSNKLRDQLHRILGAKYASISLTFKLDLKLQSSVITCYHYDWAGSNCLNSKGYVVSRKKGGNANLRTKLRKRE